MKQFDIYGVKNKIIDSILVTSLFLIGFSQILATFRTLHYGLDFVHYLQLLIILPILFSAIYRKKLNVSHKVLVLLLLMLITFITGISKYGFLASAKIYIILIGSFLLIVRPYKQAVLLTFFVVVIYLIYGYFYTTGRLNYTLDAEKYIRDFSSWSMEAVTIFTITFFVMYFIKYYSESLIEGIKELEIKNKGLTERETKYRSLFESSNDAIMLMKNGVFFDCNNRTLELFGVSKDDIIGKKPIDFSPEYQPDGNESAPVANQLMDKVFNGVPQFFEWQHKNKNGELFDAQVNLNLIELGNEKSFQAVVRDITEKKKNDAELENYRKDLEKIVKNRTFELETTNEEIKATNEELYSQRERLQEAIKKLHKTQSQLIDAEKMATIGILTAGVAHEINNPLNFIQTGLYSLQNVSEAVENGESFDNYIKKQRLALEHIEEGIDRIADITRSLNHFNRKGDGEFEQCNLHVIIDNCLRILNNNIKYKSEVVRDYNPKDITLIADEGKLHQLFINIINNANQAIQENGQITISTYQVNHFVFVKISDNGEGIPSENLHRLWDPFFTTKNVGEGTGLGLYIVYSIVQEHKGHIDVESEVGVGTTFTISLPLITNG